VQFERKMRSCLLKEGENTDLAVGVIVLVIILCPLSSLKVLYYAITANTIARAIAHRAKWCKIIGSSKNSHYLFCIKI